ncbi:MAG: fumarylacetoacetate hydrolase family protein [Cellulomonadaceae bacterium]|jgi:2-keto-4-pentenoate hydratase/2-oxohepta-3-ene-1,7-dioic acid hydratase in catechol pathway|nr:fumarylacetoacetate hydrolase family protein [Cellulomonadaceae bacterium]
MRIARFTTGGDPQYGFVQKEGGKKYRAVITGDPLFMKANPTGERIPLDDWDGVGEESASAVRLLTPVIPRSKVVCVGLNYIDHIREMGHDEPTQPVLFLKPNTAVIGPDDPIVLPEWSDEVSYEVELAIVIGRICKDVSEENALKYVLGYTIGNDVTARDAQRADGQWARAKSFDTACPLGPWIETDFDFENAEITSRVNGEVKQHSNTAQMLFNVPYLVSYISAAMTLLPGDVILTGTPAGVGRIDVGDVVECEIEGIGTLRNPVLRATA